MAQRKEDYYTVLGVAKNAAADEIKKAFRKSALAHHPDRNPGDKKSEEKFREATEAYEVLSDPEKRRVYDQYGHEGLNAGGFSPGAGFSASGFSDIFEGIFEDFFGQGSSGRRQNQGARGSDLRTEVEITFEEAVFGAVREITVEREETCAPCNGDGAKPGTARTSCPACGGRGQVLASSGFFSIARTCGRCNGQGSFPSHPCPSCKGQGRVYASKRIQVKIPAGVDNGLRLRMTGEGEAGHRGGSRGDLYVDIHVTPHELFSRDGENISCDVPVSFTQAALGCEIEIPTLAGKTTLKIPAGSQNGKVFKLKGKGIASLRGHGIGDQEVRLIVETPTHLSEKQKELLRQFAESAGEKVNPQTHSFMEKAKKLFS